MTRCTLTTDSGAIFVTAPYDAAWVTEFKNAIPATERRPKYQGKKFEGWLISPRFGKVAQDLCVKYFGEMPLLPQLANTKPVTKQTILDVRYIGITKDRGADDRSAYGWYKDGWNAVFPETVLRAWFDAPQDPTQAVTLYSVLCVSRNATADEIKTGYRRMAVQWHPDRCREPNAHEQFITIQHAYEILTKSRDRYDAGLALEASLKNTNTKTGGTLSDNLFNGYRSPLRCGLIMAEGVETMGLFQVSKIFAWADITDHHGRVLVVSWKSGADHFEEIWT